MSDRNMRATGTLVHNSCGDAATIDRAQTDRTPRKPTTQVAKAGYSVPEFCYGTGIGRSKAYELMGDGLIRFVTVGRRRIITDSPAEFLARVADAGRA